MKNGYLKQNSCFGLLGSFHFVLPVLFFFANVTVCFTINQTQDYSLDEVKKVYHLIRMIEEKQAVGISGRHSDSVEVTESEFNSYIAYRIETESEEVMKKLKFKFLGDDTLEGMIYFDLREQNLPKLLRPEMTFYFRGVLESKDGAVRLNLKELYLERQKIQPLLIDLVFSIAAKINETEAGSINDWYEIPYGIKYIKVHGGRAQFFY